MCVVYQCYSVCVCMFGMVCGIVCVCISAIECVYKWYGMWHSMCGVVCVWYTVCVCKMFELLIYFYLL